MATTPEEVQRVRTLYSMGTSGRAHMFSVLIEHFLNPWLTLSGHVETMLRMALFQWIQSAGKKKTSITVRVHNQRAKHGWATEVCPACERPLALETTPQQAKQAAKAAAKEASASADKRFQAIAKQFLHSGLTKGFHRWAEVTRMSKMADSVTGEGQAEHDELKQRFGLMLMSKVMKRWTLDASYRCYKNWYANQCSDHRYLREVMNLAMEMHSEERTHLIKKMTTEEDAVNQAATRKGEQAKHLRQKMAMAAEQEEQKKKEAQSMADGPEKDEALKELKALQERADRLVEEAAQLEKVVDETRQEQAMLRLRRAMVSWQTFAERSIILKWKNNFDVEHTRNLAASTISKATGRDSEAVKASFETDAAVAKQAKIVEAMEDGPVKEAAQVKLTGALQIASDAINRAFQDPEEDPEETKEEEDEEDVTQVPRWVVRCVKSMPDGPAKAAALKDIEEMQGRFEVAKAAKIKEAEEEAALTQAKMEEARQLAEAQDLLASEKMPPTTATSAIAADDAVEIESKGSQREFISEASGATSKLDERSQPDELTVKGSRKNAKKNPFAAKAPVITESGDFNVSDAIAAVVAVDEHIDEEDPAALKRALETQQKNQAILILKQLFKSPAQVSRCAFPFFQWKCFREEKRLEKRFDGVKARGMAQGMKIVAACVEGMQLLGDPMRTSISAWVINVICSPEATSKKENKYLHKKKQQVWKKYHAQAHANQDAKEKFHMEIRKIEDNIAEKMLEISKMNNKVHELQSLRRIAAFTNDRTAAEAGIVHLLDAEFSEKQSTLAELVDPDMARYHTIVLEDANKQPHSPYNLMPKDLPWKKRANETKVKEAYRVHQKRVQVLVYVNDGGLTAFYPDGALVVASNLYEVLDGAIQKFEEPYLRVLYSMKGDEVKLDTYQSLKPGMEFVVAPLGEAFKRRKASWQPTPRPPLGAPGGKKALPGVGTI